MWRRQCRRRFGIRGDVRVERRQRQGEGRFAHCTVFDELAKQLPIISERRIARRRRGCLRGPLDERCVNCADVVAEVRRLVRALETVELACFCGRSYGEGIVPWERPRILFRRQGGNSEHNSAAFASRQGRSATSLSASNLSSSQPASRRVNSKSSPSATSLCQSSGTGGTRNSPSRSLRIASSIVSSMPSPTRPMADPRQRRSSR
jgi:hypothetical protein